MDFRFALNIKLASYMANAEELVEEWNMLNESFEIAMDELKGLFA